MTFHDNFFSCSVDDWESKQAGWTQTAKVLKHFAEDVVTKFPGNLQCAVMQYIDLLERKLILISNK